MLVAPPPAELADPMGVLEQQQVVDQNWRKEVDRQLDEHFERLNRHEELLQEGDARMTALSEKIDANTTITKRIETNTGTLVKWVENVTGFKNTVNWFASLLLKLAAIAVALGIVVWWLRTGELPRKAQAEPATVIAQGPRG